MSRKTAILVTLALLIFAGGARSQSLADLAKKEKERREQVKAPARVITNQEAAKFSSGPVTSSAQSVEASAEKPAPGKPPAAETAAKTDKPASDEPVDFQGRPESFWRQTLGDARKRIKDLETEANALQLKFADTQNQFYRESSGFHQQTLQRNLNKLTYEIDLNKERLAAAKAQLLDLENEARKSGALPGWLLEKPTGP